MLGVRPRFGFCLVRAISDRGDEGDRSSWRLVRSDRRSAPSASCSRSLRSSRCSPAATRVASDGATRHPRLYVSPSWAASSVGRAPPLHGSLRPRTLPQDAGDEATQESAVCNLIGNPARLPSTSVALVGRAWSAVGSRPGGGSGAQITSSDSRARWRAMCGDRGILRLCLVVQPMFHQSACAWFCASAAAPHRQRSRRLPTPRRVGARAAGNTRVWKKHVRSI